MYETIGETLEHIFDDVLVIMSGFQKKTYGNTFMQMYEKYKLPLQKFIDACEASEDPEQVIEELASYVPKKAQYNLTQIESKRKREFLMLDYNMGLVTFYTPLISYDRHEFYQRLAARTIEKWNEEFPKFKLQMSSFETIQAGFKSRLCYITTAVCESQGKSDNCYELNLLRDYRDNYLIKVAGEADLVQEYYNVAPTIVKRIGHSQDAHLIYNEIWDMYLSPCIALLQENKQAECKDIYCNMVNELKEKYLYNN